MLRAFYIKNNTPTGIFRNNILYKGQHHFIGINNLAAIAYQHYTIAITIKGNTKSCVFFVGQRYKVLQVFLSRWIRMVIWEVTICFAIQGHHLATERSKELGSKIAGHSIATIDNHLMGFFELDVLAHSFYIVGGDIKNA